MSEGDAGRGRRLALVGPFAPLRGGIAQFNDRLYDELVRRGNSVTAVSFRRQYPGLLFPGTSQIDPDADGAANRVMDSIWPPSWSAAGRAIADSGAKAAVASYWTPHLAPVLAGTLRRSGVPGIGLVHNALPHSGGLTPARSLARWFLRSIDAAMALTEAVAEDLRALGFQGPIAVSPHPPYDHFGERVPRADARRRLGIPDEARLVLCFGLVRDYKGFDLALDALGKILETLPQTILAFAGEAYDPSVDRRIEALPALQVEQVRRDARFLPADAVIDWFSAADLLLLPYRQATQSGPMATAAHFELPCVVANVGGLAVEAERFGMGLVFPPEDAGALAECVMQALEPETHARLVEGARETRRQSGWGVFATALESLIDTTLVGT